MIMTEENIEMDSMGNVSSIKDRLRQVANEIDTLKNSFSKGTEELSRIQNMLDVEKMEDVTTIVENYESRISDMEKKREEAADGAKKYSEELEKEKERLIKLWDAYNNQE